MQEGKVLPAAQVNRDLLRSILETPRWFWPVITLLGLVVLAASITIGVMIDRGLGITGLNYKVVWGFFITNFVFWIGISHAGVMLSAILRLAKAEWRRPGHPRRRGADHLLADDGHDHAHHPHRAALAHPLLGLPLRLRPRRLAEHPHAAGLGPVRDPDLPDVVHHVRPHCAGAGLCRVARPHHRLAAHRLQDARNGLGRATRDSGSCRSSPAYCCRP